MAAGDLTDLIAVKTYLGTSEAALDTVLGELITDYSKRFQSEIDRSLVSASHTDTVDGDGGTVLVLKHYPATAVTSVKVGSDAIVVRPDTDSSGYLLVDQIKIVLDGYLFTEGIQNVEVQYTAGYATIPADIKQAVTEWVAWAHHARGRTGLVSENVEGATVAYSPYDKPLSVKSVIDFYRRREA